jgi:hypothetical protein
MSEIDNNEILSASPRCDDQWLIKIKNLNWAIVSFGYEIILDCFTLDKFVLYSIYDLS